MELSGHLLYPGHLLKKKGKTICFAKFITMLSTLLRIVEPFVSSFTRNLGSKPWTSLKKNPKCKGTLYPTTGEREWWL